MPEVLITAEAQTQFDGLSLAIKARVGEVFVRLARWPDVSGAKPLAGGLAGSYRVRTGDYRVVFRLERDAVRTRIVVSVIVWKIGNRKDVYLD